MEKGLQGGRGHLTVFAPGDVYPKLEKLRIISSVMGTEYSGGVLIELPLLNALEMSDFLIWTCGAAVRASTSINASPFRGAVSGDLVISAPLLEHLVFEDIAISTLPMLAAGNQFHGAVSIYAPSLEKIHVMDNHGSTLPFSALSSGWTNR
uniref:Uncharacterized protein n=1 Tax=Leersia perrieri TaxID=77586 RepID=A0A0D9WWY9_9ORYZ